MTLSGNQALVYDDCQLTHQRAIPLPDYCANDSSLIISVADSAIKENEQLPGTGVFVSVLLYEYCMYISNIIICTCLWLCPEWDVVHAHHSCVLYMYFFNLCIPVIV